MPPVVRHPDLCRGPILTQNDPTNSALAAIASIFGPSRRVPAEQPTAPEGDARQAEEAAAPSSEHGGPDEPQAASEASEADGDHKVETEAVADQPGEGAAEAEAGSEAAVTEAAAETEATDAAEPDADSAEPVEADEQQQAQSADTAEQIEAETAQDEQPDDQTPATPAVSSVAMSDEEIEGYSRSGPGPLDLLRFSRTARRDEDGAFYVDETIGFASRPISTGPLPRDQVIAFIDERARQAQERSTRCAAR
ncbi:MAG: hypothetical protein MZV49_27395 [Rhodopseudomonas palustris]|nr:hypothetical protein [Rhodopseudomonas palustris]